VDLEPFFEEMDYKNANELLKKERRKSIQWLQDAIKNYKKTQNQEVEIQWEIFKEELHSMVNSFIQYPLYKKKYLKYRILSCFTFGKIKKKFRKRKKLYKQKLQETQSVLFKNIK
jgi:hypothetical protein